MKPVYNLAYLVFSLVFSCASTSSLMFDYNMNVDFESFSTYVLCSDDFMVINDDHPKIDNEITRRKIALAVAEAMEARGHKTNVFNPELQSGFRIAIKEKTAKFNNCEHSKELLYWESCSIHKETYEEETLIVYVANFETNQVLWQASIPCHLDQPHQKLDSYISELVEMLFDTYPKTANLN